MLCVHQSATAKGALMSEAAAVLLVKYTNFRYKKKPRLLRRGLILAGLDTCFSFTAFLFQVREIGN